MKKAALVLTFIGPAKTTPTRRALPKVADVPASNSVRSAVHYFNSCCSGVISQDLNAPL